MLSKWLNNRWPGYRGSGIRWLHNRWFRHSLWRCKIPYSQWHTAVQATKTISGLNRHERVRLRSLASYFLNRKTITFIGEFEDITFIRTFIAAQACLLILNLKLDDFDGWQEVIVYPHTFVVTREESDQFGVKHRRSRVLAGEAWSRGPLVISWEDANPFTPQHSPGANVILHEFAHKLDMLNGAADGFPPLHRNMLIKSWTEALTVAFEDLNHQLDHHEKTLINPYAATEPGEFFAVLTEVFFEQPEKLNHLYPRVYQQFMEYYRQDPCARAG